MIMVRFAIFVDGSNLYGSLRSLGVEVDDYQAFYEHLFEVSRKVWSESVCASNMQDCLLQRVYWYQVGTMDDWDLDDAQAQAYLKERFESYKQFRDGYMSRAGTELEGKPQSDVALKAWAICFAEMRSWYEHKQETLAGMKRFHHAVQKSTDIIDILEVGHWKVDFFTQSCEEKGLDTRLAVDMVALKDNYDVAVIVSGDADSIPSIDLMKKQGKHIGAVEFVKGYPPEERGRGFSSRIKLAADFVARIYEMQLVGDDLATKP